jgi:hypothetical protein
MFLLARRNESQAITDQLWWVLGEFFWPPFLNVDAARSEMFKSRMPARHAELLGKVRANRHKPRPRCLGNSTAQTRLADLLDSVICDFVIAVSVAVRAER